ncbi:MAG: hypothetical protein IPG54_06635 [Sphingomonadales bacterium]|nr:hypothetical protein [Sphingomonadales bacterium]
MRFAALSLAPIALFALASCGEGGVVDENLKSTVRQSIVSSCAATAEGQVPEGVNVDLNKVCDCAADRLMAGKSVQELIANPPTSMEDLAPVKECLKEVGPVTVAQPAEG